MARPAKSYYWYLVQASFCESFHRYKEGEIPSEQIGSLSNLSSTLKFLKSFLLDNCRTYNINDNPKNNILKLENIRQKILTILEYFNAYICHHYQPKNNIDNDGKYMHRNIPELFVFFVWYFPTLRCYFQIIVHIICSKIFNYIASLVFANFRAWPTEMV